MHELLRAPLDGGEAAYVDDGTTPILIIDPRVPDDRVAAVEAAVLALLPGPR